MSTRPSSQHLAWIAFGLTALIVALSWASTPAPAQNAPAEQVKPLSMK